MAIWWLERHHRLKTQFADIKIGDVVHVDQDWHPVFLIVPRRGVSRRWIWGRQYRRRVWIYTGFVDEPDTQYGTLFDILRWS
jgi:hypothetical protein